MNQSRATYWLLSASNKARRASAQVRAMVAKAVERFFEFCEELRLVAIEIGWAEYGGSIIRDPDTGEVCGRTPWVPRSELWPGRPDKALTEKQAHAALRKAQDGDKLSPIEGRFVRHVCLTMCDRMAA
jgi:hypothetical protein